MDLERTPGHDSAVYLENDRLSTITVDSDVFAYPEEYGRTYHSLQFEEANHPFPNDEEAQDLERERHQIYLDLHDDKLYLAPLREPQDVLDLGTGTAEWAIAFADKNPQATIIAVDISPIQTTWVPPNLLCQVLDIERTWDFNRLFHYIHVRDVNCSIYRPEILVGQAFQHLHPEGWFEIQEPISLDMQNISPSSGYLTEWLVNFNGAVRHTGRDPDLARKYEDIMMKQGFVRVKTVIKHLPLGWWPLDPKLKKLGASGLRNFLNGLEGFSLRLFTQTLGWTRGELEVLLGHVRTELKDMKAQRYMPIYTVIGQKPSEAAVGDSVLEWLHDLRDL
ncbi:hypothetical protein H2200_007543 [Cladophialophora chaetospira]|uniref:S-adenosyl-L-methionine-dependent methyltransferase n=1 Tax=Cladophialophora chaetospira TaxID=386627 RepID=A0AA38X7Z7_9EURO|nr:hypothetical protein H2200_007543 [Cladophialophora chaetospira]